MAETNVIVRVDEELKTAFAQAARNADRTTSQLLRDFMRDYVKQQREEAEYEAFLRKKVEIGLADIREGRVHSSEEVEAYFAKRRAESRRLAAKSEE